jgi:hypothetical protein
MRNSLIICLLLISSAALGQLKSLQLSNALVVAQLDKQDDRYSLEVNLTELLVNNGVKALPSLNVLKFGSDITQLSSDSIQSSLKMKGYDTYVLVSVRGYDKRFKASTRVNSLGTALSAGNLFPIYRDEVTSVSFEFLFFRNGEFLGSDIVKCGNVSSRDTVLKRFRKHVGKRILKEWVKK